MYMHCSVSASFCTQLRHCMYIFVHRCKIRANVWKRKKCNFSSDYRAQRYPPKIEWWMFLQSRNNISCRVRNNRDCRDMIFLSRSSIFPVLKYVCPSWSTLANCRRYPVQNIGKFELATESNAISVSDLIKIQRDRRRSFLASAFSDSFVSAADRRTIVLLYAFSVRCSRMYVYMGTLLYAFKSRNMDYRYSKDLYERIKKQRP